MPGLGADIPIVIHAWLDLPEALIFLVLVALYGVSGAAIYWFSFHSPAHKRVQRLTGVVAPYFGAVAVLFALLTGFLGAEVAERNRQAERSVLSESSALDTLVSLSRVPGVDGKGVRAAAQHYLEAVLTSEWAAMSTGHSSAVAAGALSAMIETAATSGAAGAGITPAQIGLLNAAARVASARAERLSFAADRSYELKWISVLLLGILTQVALTLVHLERSRAMLAAVSLFSLAAIVALGLIAAQENPFEPPHEVSNAPLMRTLAMLKAEP